MALDMAVVKGPPPLKKKKVFTLLSRSAVSKGRTTDVESLVYNAAL